MLDEQALLDGIRILYVAYPLLIVSDESAGGAEQVLWTLERELARRGGKTTVAASAGSRVTRELFATGDPSARLDDFERRNREHQDSIVEFVSRRAREGTPFDLVHDMSGSFWTRAAEIDGPVLATLHLPKDFYPAGCFENVPDNVTFNFVSETQARSFGQVSRGPSPVIGNGIALDRFVPNLVRGGRSGLLWLGRICEEKGTHLAIDIARRAAMPIALAGQTYPFSYHRDYFERDVAPRLSSTPHARFIGPVSGPEKHRLLCEASALLVTSQVAETSSLVAMEAAASGTPVIAFRRGALAEVVCEGITGFLVEGIEEAVDALHRIDEIRPATCVRHACDHFSSGVMAEEYLRLYGALMRQQRASADPGSLAPRPSDDKPAALKV